MMVDDASRRQEEKLLCLLGSPGQITEVLLAIGFGARCMASAVVVQAQDTIGGDAVASDQAQKPTQLAGTTVKCAVPSDDEEGLILPAGDAGEDAVLKNVGLDVDGGVHHGNSGASGLGQGGDAQLADKGHADEEGKRRRVFPRKPRPGNDKGDAVGTHEQCTTTDDGEMTDGSSSPDEGGSVVSSSDGGWCEAENDSYGPRVGVVKKLFDGKNYGFIKAVGEGDIFFHVKDCPLDGAQVGKGDRLYFNLWKDKRTGRLRAAQCRQLSLRDDVRSALIRFCHQLAKGSANYKEQDGMEAGAGMRELARKGAGIVEWIETEEPCVEQLWQQLEVLAWEYWLELKATNGSAWEVGIKI